MSSSLDHVSIGLKLQARAEGGRGEPAGTVFLVLTQNLSLQLKHKMYLTTLSLPGWLQPFYDYRAL
jgi:hypothetical protein